MNIITVNKILDIISEYFGVDKEDILKGGRQRHLAKPRQIAMFLAYKYTGLSHPALGRAFGKHHTNIVYACKTIGKDEQYKTILYDLDKILVKELQKEFRPNNHYDLTLDNHDELRI
jgi:chromosomal replication initiator protein